MVCRIKCKLVTLIAFQKLKNQRSNFPKSETHRIGSWKINASLEEPSQLMAKGGFAYGVGFM
jgi:hypothetical protein